jgi:tetratricopeptide (TPR) repeat protein
LQGRIEAKQGLSRYLRRADEKFKEAIEIFEELRKPFELGKSYYYYSEFLKNNGEIEKAREYIKKAEEIFEKIGAKGWLRKLMNYGNR